METRPIRSVKEYRKALAEIDKLVDCRVGSKEEDRLVVLSLLVEAYEQEHYPIAPPDPIEAIKFRMEQLGFTRKDLGRILGSQTRADDLLRGRRRLTLPTMRVLHAKLGVSAETLLAA
ncbi:MAG: transcriptional regulator [Ignavibacteriae bacterium]|nr:transcriptional regulator [Ignavibacteriota bacterium]